ncbi:MAG TPA: Rieske (2Fe-2S) protein [Gemmatimonadota bacterium]|nr:Rieske (2Fe-2S) protein [Gemmatimonadota bacterium]
MSADETGGQRLYAVSRARDDSGRAGGGRAGSGGSRRRFLNWLLGTGAGAVAAAVIYPVLRYLNPPEIRESTTSQVTLSVRTDDIPPNSGQIFKFGNRPGIILRTPDGELRAFTAICTHLACIVQYRDDLSHIWCACHNGHYDLRGQNIKGPPPRPLTAYTVVVQDDKIIVSKEA